MTSCANNLLNKASRLIGRPLVRIHISEFTRRNRFKIQCLNPFLNPLDWLYDSLSSPPVAGVWWAHWHRCPVAAAASSKWMLHTGGGWGENHMIIKRFGCTAIHNKVLYKCIIHSLPNTVRYFSVICIHIYFWNAGKYLKEQYFITAPSQRLGAEREEKHENIRNGSLLYGSSRYAIQFLNVYYKPIYRV